MFKPEVLDWNDFFKDNPSPEQKKIITTLQLGLPIFLVTIPKSVLAADSTFSSIWPDVIRVIDWLDIGIIAFAGVTWMFGNRTKGIEFLIGSSVGYLIARHAMEINAWLKSI